MNRGFYTIMAAQFFSSLADNALLIAAIALLSELAAPAWMTPLLRLCFTLSYIIFAAYVGIFADSMPKGRVMFLTNTLKAVGCLFMLFGGHPLLAYAIVGLGAAAYSPAKYGILTELLPPDKLVVANGWIEGLTVISIILGVVLGGALILPAVADPVLAAGVLQTIGIHTRAGAAISIVFFIYLIAAACNLFIPDTGVRYPKADFEPIKTVCNFLGSCKALWTDKLGQTSLAVTSMFWGAGAVLQFLVLSWADTNFGLNLSQASILQAVVSVGIAIGAVGAATFVPLKKCLKVLPMGVLMGVVVVFAAHFNRAMAPSVITLPGGFEISWAIIIAGCIMVLVGALLRSADERPPSEPRLCSDERGPLDRRPELQRKFVDADHAWHLLAHDQGRPHLHPHHGDLRRLCRDRDDHCDPHAPPQRDRSGSLQHDRRRKPASAEREREVERRIAPQKQSPVEKPGFFDGLCDVCQAASASFSVRFTKSRSCQHFSLSARFRRRYEG